MSQTGVLHLVHAHGRQLFGLTGLAIAAIAGSVVWLDSFPPALAAATTLFCGLYAVLFLRFLHLQREAEESLRRAREAGEQAQQARKDFLSTISHEIRTPMNAIVGMAGLLRGTPLDVRQEEFARAIDDSAQALRDIINDILDFSRIDAGKLQLENAPFDPAELAESCTDILALPAHTKGLHLMCHIAPGLPARLEGDAARIRQILLNLVGNAVKFTDAGEVNVRVESSMQPDGRCRLNVEVLDTGIGMDGEMLRRLFSPFSQADASLTRRHGGTGLGLSICKRLADLMGGQLAVTSIPGQGSCFCLTLDLPLAADPAGALPAPLAGMRILLVEPHEASVCVLRDYLDTAGAEVSRVKTAGDALLQMQSANAPVAVVVSSEVADMAPEALAALLARQVPAIRCVLLEHGTRLQTQQQQAPASVGILHWPLRRTALWQALGGCAATSAAKAIAPPPDAVASILLVEDNLMNQQVARHQLHAFGHNVDIACNGEEGVAMVRHGGYALVLMDCQMPVMDGYEATRRIRDMEAELGRRTPIVAMTANAMAGDRELCLAAGMDDYLTKPLVKGRLEAVLQQYLGAVKRPY